MAVPNIFGTATSAIPLSQLDTNFATAITLGNTAVYLGNTTTSFGNVTLTNVTISSGNLTVTSPAIFPAGTAALPAITTTGDTNTGIFFPAADTIAFSEGGAECARFDSAGNLLIGTTSQAPLVGGGKYLTLYNTSNTTLSIQAVDSGNDRYATLELLSSGAGGSISQLVYGDTRTVSSTQSPLVFASYYSLTRVETLRLNTTGNLVLKGGNVNATGVGVSFPATQVASSDANCLDDYEEGLWTFEVTTNTGSVTMSGASDTCFYIKIGRFVTVGGQVTVASVSSPTGFISVSLPFPTEDLSETAEYVAGAITVGGSVSKNANDFGLLKQDGTDMRIYIADVSALSSGNANAQQLQASSLISFQLSYYASA